MAPVLIAVFKLMILHSLSLLSEIILEEQEKVGGPGPSLANLSIPRIAINDSSDRKLDKLTNWLISKGGEINGVEISQSAVGLRGLVATKDLKEGELLLKVPLNATIHEDFKTEDPIIELAKQKLTRNQLLAVILIQEMKNENSILRPYFDVLPESLNNFPIFYNSEELSLLNNTCFLRQVKSLKEFTSLKWKEIVTEIPELSSLSEDEFAKMFTYASSRCCGVTINHTHKTIMVPMFDMINAALNRNDSKSNTKVYFSDELQAALVYATENIKAGEDLRLYYRPDFTNTNYLRYYGFLFENSDEISYVLEFDFPLNDPLTDQKQELLKSIPKVMVKNTTVFAAIENSSDTNSFHPLFSAIRILTVNDSSTLARIRERLLEGEMTIPPISRQNELLAMKELRGIAAKALSKYPTTILEDKKMLDESPPLTNKRNIVLIRKLEKELLVKLMEYCEYVINLISVSA